MDEKLFASLVSQIQHGKQLPNALYVHKDALTTIPKELREFIPAVAQAVSLPDDQWNIVKLFKKEFRLSLLWYPTFYSDAYPALQQSSNVNLSKLKHTITRYKSTDNPPILHRKETMILPNSEYYPIFKMITQEGENAGLYQNSRLIGFKQSWNNLIAQHGYELVDGRLFRCSAIPLAQNEKGIDRYKTAIVRHELSAPMKILAKHGYLDGRHSIFDYGCGRGDDLRELEAHGFDALGWDPNFRPDVEPVAADLVNLGFVLNVIEDQDERLEALLNSWELANKCLIVSVMLANESFINQFKPYKDGIITSRNTFQKYYSQSEIKNYIERNLQEDAIPAAPGIFLVFKDKLEEQKYIQNKYKRHYNWNQQTSPDSFDSKEKSKLLISKNKDLFESFWQCCLELGRLPTPEEFTESVQIKNLIGSPKKTFNLLREMFDYEQFKNAAHCRREDLLLYFANELFGKRKPYTKLSDSLKRDIKAQFGNYKTALSQASELLFKISNIELIEAECIRAHKLLPASILNEGHSLILHKQYLSELPLLLRTYVCAALQMYGEIDESIDLIKIHITSGKLTLTAYDDFERSVPYLAERIKIKMAAQEIDFFDYIDEQKRPPLLNKHLYLSSNHPNYLKQKSFDIRLTKLLEDDHDRELIYSRTEYEILLAKKNKKINGFTIVSI